MSGDVAQFPAGRAASGRRWGKAGVPLNEKDAETARRARRAAANKAKLRTEAEREAHPLPPAFDGRGLGAPHTIEDAHTEWAAGHVYPHRITQALNLRQLDGPEVDAACDVEEPAVDEWEMGIRYPTWEQLVKLAKLTGFDPWFFTRPVRRIIDINDTSYPIHDRLRRNPGEPCLRSRPAVFGGYMFDPEAIRRTLGGGR